MKMLDKKGISPLIAWVLIIGLAIGIGVAVINWAIDITPEPDVDLSYCDDVSISYVYYDFSAPGNDIEVNLSNNGYFSVDRISFGFSRVVDEPANDWCDYLIQDTPGGDSFEPGGEMTFAVYLDSFNLDCGDVGGGDPLYDIESVRYVTAVPWISIDGETLNCNDRKIGFGVAYNSTGDDDDDIN